MRVTLPRTALLGVALFTEPAMATPPPLELNHLSAGTWLTATVTATETGPSSQKPVAWFSVVTGTAEPGPVPRWRAHDSAFDSDADVLVHTAEGAVTVPVRKLRPHLEPHLLRRFPAGTPVDPALPEGARAALAEWQAEGEAVLAEYALLPGQTYQVRVVVETYSLPPGGPGEPPQSGENRVLQITNGPTEALLPVAPPFDGWSY